MTYGNGSKGMTEKILTGLLAVAFIALFIVMTQPAWRGKEMVSGLKSDCDKVGGVMLEHKMAFGTSYECSPRYDKGIKQ